MMAMAAKVYIYLFDRTENVALWNYYSRMKFGFCKER
jgi:hypothetical protein